MFERAIRERDVGIICVIIYDDLALKAWTQRRERERERESCSFSKRQAKVASLSKELTEIYAQVAENAGSQTSCEHG